MSYLSYFIFLRLRVLWSHRNLPSVCVTHSSLYYLGTDQSTVPWSYTTTAGPYLYPCRCEYLYAIDSRHSPCSYDIRNGFQYDNDRVMGD